jgi:hypothetical protein
MAIQFFQTANFANSVTATSFVKSGGTSSQYLMADGSVSTGSSGVAWTDITSKPTTISGFGITDAFSGSYADLTNVPSTFAPSAHNHDGTYLKLSGGTMTGDITMGGISPGKLKSNADLILQVDADNNSTGSAFKLLGGGGGTLFKIVENGNIDAHGVINFTGTATTTSVDRGLYWTGFDKEQTTDFSDNASITHTTNTGGHSGSVLEIKSMNDSTDGIAFTTNASSLLKHNGNAIFSEGHKPTWSEIESKPSTFAPSSHNHAASEITSGTFATARIPNLAASKITSGTLATARLDSSVLFGNNSSGTNEGNFDNWNDLNKTGFYSDSDATGKWTTSNWSSVMHFRLYDDNNNWASQLGFDTYDTDFYYRRKNNGTWSSWFEVYHEGHKPTWSEVESKPSTFTPSSHNQAWSTITSTPTTLSGYGITDAAAAGDENIIDGALSIWNADGDGDVFTYNDSNPVHNGKTLGAVINIKGDGAENGSLVRAGVYTGDHISVSRGYYVGTELNTTTANTTQVITADGNFKVGARGYELRSGSITVNGDADTYYPVTWFGGYQAHYHKIQIHRNYNETAPSTWNSSTHKGGLVLDLEANWGGWGGIHYDIKINEFSEIYSTMVGQISHFANSRGFAIWLRGGGAVYHFSTQGIDADPAVQLSAYDPGNNSTGVSSRTSIHTGFHHKHYYRSGTLYSQNSQVLTAADEGSGNGIDADTVDGNHASAFVLKSGDTMTGQLTATKLRTNHDGSQAAPRYDTSFYVAQSQHYYGQNGSQTMYLGESGNDVLIRGQVAIGGTAIQSGYDLTLSGHVDLNSHDINYVNQLHFSDDVRFYDDGNDNYLNFKWGDTGGGGIKFRDGNSNIHGYVYGSSDDEFGFLDADGNWAVRIDKDTAVDLRINNSSRLICDTGGTEFRNGGTIVGEVTTSGVARFISDVIAYYSYSDQRLKTDIKATTNNLDKILKLEPVEYTWKDGGREGKKEIGLIAQDVEKVVPEVVRENERLNDDTLYKQVDYEHLVSTLIGAIQEQQDQIAELKSEVTNLKSTMCNCKK